MPQLLHPTAQVGSTRHCLAYSQVTGDLRAFHGDSGGTLLYHPMRFGAKLAVGDPLADAQDHQLLLDQFLTENPRANFIQCSETFARQLQARGFFVNSFGVETDLILSGWSAAGKRAHMLRKNFNKADRAGVKVVEITADPEQLSLARSISDGWLWATNRTLAELRLLTRVPVFAAEPGTRKFASYHERRMVGIGFFDPLCLADEHRGYVYQIVRELPDAPDGTRTHLLLSVADLFRASGVERLSLGLSPNCLAGTEPLRYSDWTRRFLQLSRKWAWYNYEGQEFYKSRFGGEENPVFFASRSRFALPSLLSLAYETGILNSYLSQCLRRPLPRSAA